MGSRVYDHEKIKESLLDLASKGEPRPKQLESLEGRFLSGLTCMTHAHYDADFDEHLRSVRPDWFKKPRCSSRKNKDDIISFAKSGKDRKELPKNLSCVLSHYVSANGSGFDSEFKDQIMKMRPDWFVSSRAEFMREKLLTAAKNGDPRPHFYLYFTRPKEIYYDASFANQLRNLRPDWFITGSRAKGAECRRNLLAIAKAGGPKPSPSRDIKLYRQWRRYSHNDPDHQFIEEIKKFAPHWFNATVP